MLSSIDVNDGMADINLGGTAEQANSSDDQQEQFIQNNTEAPIGEKNSFSNAFTSANIRNDSAVVPDGTIDW